MLQVVDCERAGVYDCVAAGDDETCCARSSKGSDCISCSCACRDASIIDQRGWWQDSSYRRKRTAAEAHLLRPLTLTASASLRQPVLNRRHFEEEEDDDDEGASTWEQGICHRLHDRYRFYLYSIIFYSIPSNPLTHDVNFVCTTTQVNGGSGAIAARASTTVPMESASLIRGCAMAGMSAATRPMNAIALTLLLLLLHPLPPPVEDLARGRDQ